eukprot:s1673_g23.t1
MLQLCKSILVVAKTRFDQCFMSEGGCAIDEPAVVLNPKMGMRSQDVVPGPRLRWRSWYAGGRRWVYPSYPSAFFFWRGSPQGCVTCSAFAWCRVFSGI